MQEANVVAVRDGRVGRIKLNRPKALNALDISMIRAITAALEEWREIPSVHAVVMEGEGERAFCAGGDIRAIRQSHLDGRTDEVEAFFSEEYALNLLIATYPKPYVALVDGICMGGGIGVSVHGTARVASEHALFAMPETAIGFFPDIGATYVLPRLPGALGTYLALTGARVQGADAVHAGLATHFVPRAGVAALSAALARDGVAVLAVHAAPLPEFSLALHRAVIDHAFAADSVPEIVARLEADGGAFARETVKTLRTMSPSSLVWSLRLLRQGAERTLPACLDAELRATRTVTAGPEFLEGVRAMVVDKDRAPKWRPARIEDVDRGAAEAMVG
ncbi:MAG TPA: enoyl-CoA hydratase/isomerase family protein [Acetobacteraceae bacterium]|nr:enoyl-CoA hydratase/isomerase family protein [Acetobacteraceae bacterium]